MEATDQNLLKMIKDDISERILSRIDPSYLEEVCKDEKFVVIAGNSLNKAKPHDIDVYRFLEESAEEKPVETVLQVGYSSSQPVRAVAKLDWCTGQGGPHRVVYESANARTVKHDDTTYQYCAYQKPFHKLIESFDFAHVQVGAVLDLKSHKITEVYFTDKYVRWLLTGKSCFTGSEFPLSSLLRAEKYKRYEVLNSHEFRTCVLTALGDVKRSTSCSSKMTRATPPTASMPSARTASWCASLATSSFRKMLRRWRRNTGDRPPRTLNPSATTSCT